MKSRKSVAIMGISALSVALLLSGCSSKSPTSSPTPTSTISITPSATPSQSPTVEMRTLAQYWVADTSRGFRLFREFVRIAPTPDPITASLRELVTHKPVDSDYENLWPADTKINSVLVAGDSAIVDLTFSKLNVGAESESLAIAQLVWTATAADTSVKKISLTVDGKRVESLAGHADATKPFTHGLTYEVLAPVWITSPTEGQSVNAVGFTLSGMASTFEANVAWKVYRDGKLIKQGSTTAAEAAPAWKPWSIAISGLAPGKYLFMAMEYSAKDGSLVAQDSKNVVLN
ncbi:MAG: GerMN domain-containing protein [Actinobacteria bacterium]|nr:GerMN domain-containing protein [Actinomycetota bacterium]